MQSITEERARAIALANLTGTLTYGADYAGTVRDHLLPTLDDDGVWLLCDAIRDASRYPAHVPTPATHSVDDARWWVDGWLA
jgi:hypothetical protein